jgi:hypothetical protein
MDLTEQGLAQWFNKASRDERLRLTREAIMLERQLDGMYESESDFDFRRAEELNDRIIELSVRADELRRARRSGRSLLDKPTAHRHNNGVMLVRFTQPEKPGQRITRPCVHRAVWFAIGMATNPGRSRGG